MAQAPFFEPRSAATLALSVSSAGISRSRAVVRKLYALARFSLGFYTLNLTLVTFAPVLKSTPGAGCGSDPDQSLLPCSVVGPDWAKVEGFGFFSSRIPAPRQGEEVGREPKVLSFSAFQAKPGAW